MSRQDYALSMLRAVAERLRLADSTAIEATASDSRDLRYVRQAGILSGIATATAADVESAIRLLSSDQSDGGES